MSEILLAILAGILQGLTEFLPISSSGHLILFHDFFNFDFSDNLAFDVILHFGTLTAIVCFFRVEIFSLITAWLQSFFNWNLKTNSKQRLAWYLFIATIPAVIGGYFLEDQIELVFRNSALVAWMLIIFGILLYFADRFFKKVGSINDLKLNNALIIGLFQTIALIPGVSRSGITIIAGLSQKLKRDEAAHFSFLLAAPIIFGAGLKQAIDLFSSAALDSADISVLFAGFLSAVLAGYICIKLFLNFLKKGTLVFFVYYRIILGLIILILVWMR